MLPALRTLLQISQIYVFQIDRRAVHSFLLAIVRMDGHPETAIRITGILFKQRFGSHGLLFSFSFLPALFRFVHIAHHT